jgi:hypothetical protein
MNVLRGYVYESRNPYMPIVAIIFDEHDNIIGTKVVEDDEEGLQFVAAGVAACDHAGQVCANIAESQLAGHRSTAFSDSPV